jgi:cell volume regulation protein A
MIEAVFFAMGVIIFVGFFSMLFFEKTKIPDVLILMSIGALIANGFAGFDSGVFLNFADYVGALALMMILFDGGINLKFEKVLKGLPTATLFTVATFTLTCLMVMSVMYLLGWDLLQGLLLGAVIGGTSSAIVIPIVSKIGVNECIRIFLTLEATLTDVLCIIAAITISGVIMSGSADFREMSNSLLSAFSIGAFIAFVFGIIWIKILARFHRMPFGYLLTVGVIFLLYSIVEFSKGNGAIAAFVFGLVLGNSTDIARVLRIDGNFVLSESIRSFQEEVSFFIRTFFFVYLGLIFNLKILNDSLILTSTVVTLALILARVLSTRFISRRNGEMAGSGTLIGSMMPRGLAAAVLASSPLIVPSVPGGFTDIVILIIVFTNVLATVGSFIYERDQKKKKAAGGDKEGVHEALCEPSAISMNDPIPLNEPSAY